MSCEAAHCVLCTFLIFQALPHLVKKLQAECSESMLPHLENKHLGLSYRQGLFQLLMIRSQDRYLQFKNVFALVLEKTLESPLGCKEIHPLHPEGH